MSSHGLQDVAYFRSSRTIASKSTVLLPVTCHKPGDSGLYFKQSATMPCLIRSQLIRNWRPRSNQRHVAAKNIEELWQFVQARFAKKAADRRDPLVTRQLVDSALAWSPPSAASLLISFVT